MDKVRTAICGTGFISAIHAGALRKCPECDLVAVYSRDKKRGEQFGDKFSIPEVFTDYNEMVASTEIDAVLIGVPNDLHKDFCVRAANRGKHVFVEAPLCLTLAEADEMISACRRAGVVLFYGENIIFAPMFAKALQLVEEEAVGEVFLVKHRRSVVPHADWYWDANRTGGGVFIELGCHGIEFARKVLGKRSIETVFLNCGIFVHRGRTSAEDDSIMVITFDGGARAVIENSWAQRGGAENRIEIYGFDGVIFADLINGTSLRTYSEKGTGGSSRGGGWTISPYNEEFLYGYPDELGHFIRCCQGIEKPTETGEDGKVILETIFAGYESARSGKVVKLPFNPPPDKKPIELWKKLK